MRVDYISPDGNLLYHLSSKGSKSSSKRVYVKSGTDAWVENKNLSVDYLEALVDDKILYRNYDLKWMGVLLMIIVGSVTLFVGV